MKCGFCKKVITPPLGTPIVGYYSERLMKGVIDDLYVRAAAFSDGEKKAVILEAVNNTIKNPFQITQSQYTTAP